MFGFFKKRNVVEIAGKEEPAFNDDNGLVEEDGMVHSQGTLVMVSGEDGLMTFSSKNEDLNEKQKDEPELQKEKTPREINLENHVGKLVICVSEQLENPIVGVGIEVIHLTKSQVPMLSIYDIIRKEKNVPLGVIFDYTQQKFDALNKMDANARVAVFFNRLGNDVIEKTPQANRLLVSPEEWKSKTLEAIERINRGEWN